MQFPQKTYKKLDWNLRALAIFKICWCFLSTIEFCWGVSKQLSWCKIPLWVKTFVMINSVPLSVLMHFTFLENCVSTMVQNCSKVSYVWDLCFNKQTKVHLEQLSTMVKKYLQPSMVETEKGPHKSQWNKSKHSLEIWELALKCNLFYLTKGHISHWNTLLELKRGALLFFIKANLAFDKCSNWECQICG